MQLSQLSDGPLNGSNRLAICMLCLLETRTDAEITFLVDHTFLYKIGSWQNFTMTFLETSQKKNAANELSFPLVTHTTHFDIQFGYYGILKSCFSSRHVVDRLDCRCSVQFFATRCVRAARVWIPLIEDSK
jgi:hypothetical protein